MSDCLQYLIPLACVSGVAGLLLIGFLFVLLRRYTFCRKQGNYETFYNDEEKEKYRFAESIKMSKTPEQSREFGQKLHDEQHKNALLLIEIGQNQQELRELREQLDKNQKTVERLEEAKLALEKEKDDALRSIKMSKTPEQSRELGQRLQDEQHKNALLLIEKRQNQQELRELREELDKNQKKIEKLEDAKLALEKEKDDALRRLSALMSNRLRDGNPNVVDLSDQNRPLKVGEQFSELYDNQWTDAFTAVQKHFGDKKSERENIETLLKIVEQCFEKCKQAAEADMSELLTHVHAISAKVAPGESKLVEDLLQRIKEERKLNAVDRVPDSKEVIQCLQQEPSVTADAAAVFDFDVVAAYLQECLKLCYLMVNQDPQMVLEFRPDPSNVENFKAYQTRGTSVAYVVWPVLFLHEGGPLVSKGVAEFGN